MRVIFISLKFVGNGIEPKINKLYEWRGAKLRDIDIEEIDGTWYWTDRRLLLRHRDARIRIGIDYVAANSFDGELKLELNAEEAAYIAKTLVFKVRNKNEEGH